jgi:hypothetical protein
LITDSWLIKAPPKLRRQLRPDSRDEGERDDWGDSAYPRSVSVARHARPEEAIHAEARDAYRHDRQ